MSLIDARYRFTQKQIMDALRVCRGTTHPVVDKYMAEFDKLVQDLKRLEADYEEPCNK